MENKNELRDELNELSPFLAERKGQEEGFRVPKDYFRSLPDEVLNQLRHEQAPAAEPQPNWLDGLAVFFQNLLQPRYAVALASLVVLLVAGTYFLQTPAEAPSSTLASISDEALEGYLSENIDDISDEMLEALFAKSSTDQLPSLEVEDLEQYLEQSLDDIDLEDLEELF